MAARALWKGSLELGEASVPVGLYTAISSAERISLNIVNRKTLHPVHRRYVDSETGETVDRDEQVKGYEIEPGRYVKITDEEIRAAVPESDKRLAVQAFVRCGDIDKSYFDKPYHLAPAEEQAGPAYRAAVEAMENLGVAALAQTVLFRRLRKILIRVDDGRLIATTLRHDYEVRPASEAFAGMEPLAIKGEMLDLAKHIVKTKTRRFDPATVVDRYQEALAELVRAKAAGEEPPRRKERPSATVVDLMQALRDSAGGGSPNTRRKQAPTKAPAKSGKPAKKAIKRAAGKTAGKPASGRKTG